jgi:hypothetical protein
VSPEVQEKWAPYLQLLAENPTAAELDLDSIYPLAADDIQQPDLLIWHGLALLQPHFDNVGNPVDANIIWHFVMERLEYRNDFSPLVWALGLQQPVALGDSPRLRCTRPCTQRTKPAC